MEIEQFSILTLLRLLVKVRTDFLTRFLNFRTPCSDRRHCQLRRPLFPDFSMAPLRSPGRPEQWDVGMGPGLESSSDSGASGSGDSGLLPDDSAQPDYGPGLRGMFQFVLTFTFYPDRVNTFLDVNSSSVDPAAALNWGEWLQLHWVPLAGGAICLVLLVFILGHSGGVRRGLKFVVELLLYASGASCILLCLLLRSLWEVATRDELPPGPGLHLGDGPQDGPPGPPDNDDDPGDGARAILHAPRADRLQDDLIGLQADDLLPGDLHGEPQGDLLGADDLFDVPGEAAPPAGDGVAGPATLVRRSDEGLGPDGVAPAALPLSMGLDQEGVHSLAGSGGGAASHGQGPGP